GRRIDHLQRACGARHEEGLRIDGDTCRKVSGQRLAVVETGPLIAAQDRHQPTDAKPVDVLAHLDQGVHGRARLIDLLGPGLAAVAGVQNDAGQTANPSVLGIGEYRRVRIKFAGNLGLLLPGGPAVGSRDDNAEFAGDDATFGVKKLHRGENGIVTEVSALPARAFVGAGQDARPAADNPKAIARVAGKSENVVPSLDVARLPFLAGRVAYPDLAVEIEARETAVRTLRQRDD